MKTSHPQKLAVICSQFPEMHETFVIRELNALKQSGIHLVIYSLKTCRDPIVHRESSSLIDVTRYAVWNDAIVLVMGILMMLRHPVKALRTLMTTLQFHGGSPVEFAKGMIVWLQAAEIARRMKDEKVTHVHAHWATMPATAAVLVHQWLDIPFSMTAHAWDIFVKNRSLKKKIKLAKGVITCTDYNRRYLQGLAPEQASKIHLNYHGVDLHKFEALSRRKKKPQFLSVGRLVEQKGYETLFKAYGILIKRGFDFSAIVVGAGPLETKLRNSLKKSGLGDRVKIEPRMEQSELKEKYREAIAFVLPCVVAKNNDRDGIPNVILEAMAVGCPVISTDISGIPEAVINQKTGIVVPAKDEKTLADALEALLNDGTLSKRLGTEARKAVAKKFSAPEHMTQLARVMKEIMQPSKKRILHIIWSLDLGGAEQMVANLVMSLDRTRYDALVCCLNTRGRYAEQLESRGIAVMELHKKPKFDPGLLIKLIQLVRKEKIDLIHTHLFTAHLWGRMAAFLTRVPVVSTEHGSDDWRKGISLTLDRMLLPVSRRMIFVSQNVKSFYESKWGTLNGKSKVIYNGIETGRFQAAYEVPHLRKRLGLKSNAYVIGIVGRLIPLKAHEVFIEAVEKLLRLEPDVQGLIVGEGPREEELRKLCEQKGIKDKIVFAGFASDITPYYQMMDVFVLCSDREGLPVAVLEAMASGVPVIATRVGGVPECLEHEKDGLLIPPRDSEALADALKRLRKDQSLRNRLIRQARENANSKFSIRQSIQAYENVYTDVILEKF